MMEPYGRGPIAVGSKSSLSLLSIQSILSLLVEMSNMPVVSNRVPSNGSKYSNGVLLLGVLLLAAAGSASAALTAVLAEADRFGRSTDTSWGPYGLIALVMAQVYGAAAWSAWARTAVIPRAALAVGLVAIYGRVLGQITSTSAFGGRFLFVSSAWVFLLGWFVRRLRDSEFSAQAMRRPRFELQDIVFATAATGLFLSTGQSMGLF